ncbi:ABC transporter ATP-binding protein [Bacillus sp. JJ1503]|uniref:ABC transporter ATP-binding protein n=1 Tax=unclassified Bacillus (in: firmicutes) TaxID=185979 RepID=UPI0030003C16
MTTKLLDIQELQVQFKTEGGIVNSVNNVTFSVDKGETVAVVGESGCGKSVTSLSILGLISSPGKITGGKIGFEDKDLTTINKKQLRKIRGNEIAMIFQEPMTSLNPVFTIGNQMSEVFRVHQNLSKNEAKEKSIDMLNRVGIPNAEKVVNNFPHQLSGGMRQRVMIAMALSCNPKLLIADEPTTALDVTIQAQILDLMKELKEESNTGMILITHDLGVVAEMADKVVVMYAGEVVEEAPVKEIFANPKHPYTEGLINSIPKLEVQQEYLDSITGSVPNPLQMPTGCAFHPRCPLATEQCKLSKPKLEQINEVHKKRCFNT